MNFAYFLEKFQMKKDLFTLLNFNYITMYGIPLPPNIKMKVISFGFGSNKH